jgi:putative ATP-dependent endonuclease of OLD family
MFLTKVQIENFRGISSLEIEFDHDITVLIGENNCGKTSVLEALRIGMDLIKSDRTFNFSEYDFYRDNEIKKKEQFLPINLTFTFEETEEHPWDDKIVQSLNEVIVGEDYSKIKLRISGWFDEEDGELKQSYCFLDDAGNEMVGKQSFLKEIRKIRPFYYLSALRDAKEEFRSQATFWSAFLRSKSIKDTTRIELESELEEINKKIVSSHLSFQDVVNEVKQLSNLISVGDANNISIDPKPADFYKTIRYTDVNIPTVTDTKVPISNHGEGTQSLCVLLLFSAYLKTRVKIDINRLAEPVIAIEEPEAHLHPNAIRAIWPILSKLPGQKIIATHSGDILSEVPVEKLRRMNRLANICKCNKIQNNFLIPEELRKFNHQVRRNRGELLFAKKWLLVEGETDVSVISECAQIMGIDIHQCGLRIVEYSQAGGPGLFIKVADSLGIDWHLVADNDQAGEKYIKSAKKLLNGRNESTHITKLSEPNMDVLICVAGYGDPYLEGINTTTTTTYPTATWEQVLDEMKTTFPEKPGQALSVAKKLEDRSNPEITAEEGTPEYWNQVYACLIKHFSKPAAALNAIMLIKNKGAAGVPDEIKQIIGKVSGASGGVQ